MNNNNKQNKKPTDAWQKYKLKLTWTSQRIIFIQRIVATKANN